MEGILLWFSCYQQISDRQWCDDSWRASLRVLDKVPMTEVETSTDRVSGKRKSWQSRRK